MSVTSDTGSFEIDTVCMAPAAHAIFVKGVIGHAPNGVTPAFTKGVITVVGCNCAHHGDLDGDGQITSLDLGLLIDHVFGGGDAPPIDPSCPHIDRGDSDCSGADDALDVARMVDVLFASGTICDPCACDPYPTNCL